MWADITQALFGAQPAWINDISNWLGFATLCGVAGLYKQHNCATKRCWKLGFHPVKDTTYRTCVKHTTGEHHALLFARHMIERPEQHMHLDVIKERARRDR